MAKKNKQPQKSGSLGVLDRQKKKVGPPKKYKVIFHNDDYTPMDFVAIILIVLFHRSTDEAWKVTMQVHEKGRGVAGGPYSREVAETKVEQSIASARSAGYPLLATFEPSD